MSSASECNPPCPNGQECVGGQRCESAAADSGYSDAEINEPPIPPAPERKEFGDRAFSMLGFHMGLGGKAEIDDTTTDLATTLGVNFRADFPVVKYIVLGPMLQFASWRRDPGGTAPTRNLLADVDFFLRGRFPVEINDPMGVQFWAGVPVGLTVSSLGADDSANLDDFGVGWNIGFLLGGAIHFTRGFGMFVEGGWVQHKMSHSPNLDRGSVDFALSQTNLNFGFVFGG